MLKLYDVLLRSYTLRSAFCATVRYGCCSALLYVTAAVLYYCTLRSAFFASVRYDWPSVISRRVIRFRDSGLLQAELNKLDVVVSLKLNQLYCMDNAFDGGRTPESTEEPEKPR